MHTDENIESTKIFIKNRPQPVNGDFRCGHFAAIISTNGNLLGEINVFQMSTKFLTFWSENPGCLRSYALLEMIIIITMKISFQANTCVNDVIVNGINVLRKKGIGPDR